MPLTDSFIKTVKPLDKAKKYFDGGGLYLYVPTNGSKLWRMAYRFADKSKDLSLGSYPTVSLKDAREKRDEAKKLLASGVDPSQEKRKAKQALILEEQSSFKNVAVEWYDIKLPKLQEKYQKIIRGRFDKFIFPRIGNMNVNDITIQDVMTVKLGPGVTAWSVDDIRSFLGANEQNSDHCWNDTDDLPYQGFISFDRFEKIGLPISIATVRRWANAGTFPKPVQLGPRKIAWRSADIWQFMNSHPATGWTPHGDKCNVVS